MKATAVEACLAFLLTMAPVCTAASAADAADRDGAAAAAGEKEGPELLLERARWFASRRAGRDGFVPIDGRNKALAELRANVAKGLLRPGPEQRIAGDGWAPIGPAPEYDATNGASFSGRVTAIALHPSNPNVAYIGTAQGGVWKTADHGLTWTALTDTQASLAIGAIAVAPSNASVIYAGTGEGNQSCDSYFGAGILHSTDGGASWALVGQAPFASTSVTKLIVHPGNPNTLWAANAGGVGGFLCSGPAGGGGTYGVWRSTDGGATWLQVLGASQIGFNTAVHDLAADPTNPNVIYAGVAGSGVWKTTNGGTGWTQLAGGLPAPSAIGRVAIAVDPATVSTVYATFSNSTNGSHYDSYKSTDAGASWLVIAKPSGPCQNWTFSDPCTYSGSTGGQCWYDLVIGVAPDHTLWLGGTGVWTSGNGGATWAAVCPQYLHTDQHALAFKGSDVWLGNDGGVFTTTNNGGLWTSRNPGLQLTQFYPGAALDPLNGTRAMAGAQDNGMQRWDGTGWTIQFTGDGSYGAIDASNPTKNWYGSWQNLNIRRTLNGGAAWLVATNGLTDAGTGASPFVAPFVMCPNNTRTLIAGSNNVWRTDDAAQNWTSNSPEENGLVTLAFARSTGNCNTYYAVEFTGRITVTTNGGTQWREANGNLGALPISDIAVDPTNAAIVILAVGGFSGHHLYRSTNALDPSPTWSSIDAGIPNAPMNAILIDPDNPSVLYAGSDVGVFRSLDSGVSWELFMGGHPNVAVFDLVAQSSTGTIVSFTHGRGAFKMGTFCNDQDACTVDRYDQVLGCTHAAIDCTDADPCTVDSCSAASGCAHVPVTAPAEVDAGLRVDRSGDDAVVSWNVAVGATSSDLLRGDLASLPVGPGGDDEVCFDAIAGSTATDSGVPSESAGYWYLVRGENSCAGAGTYGYEEMGGAPAAERVSATCP